LARDQIDGPSQRQHRHAQVNQAQRAFGSIAPMIVKTFGIVKDFRSHSANFLRAAKSLHNDGDEPGRAL
jgi:hypothetical protein